MSRRLVPVLAWALSALSLFGLAVIWWQDHLLRQASRPDLAPLGTEVVAPALAAVSAATVGAVLGQPPAPPPGGLAAAGP